MSARLLNNFGAPLRHASLDDLESLTWVLIWVGLRADLGPKKRRENLSAKERSWIEGLNNLDPGSVDCYKTAIRSYFVDAPDGKIERDMIPLKSSLRHFVAPLVELFVLHRKAFVVLAKIGDEPEHGELRPDILTCFDKYITVLHNFIQE